MGVEAILEAFGLSAEVAEDSASDARILDAALFLVGELGERRLTMDDVAATAKVGRRTVFRRFGSKEALLQRLYSREVLQAVEHITPANDESADLVTVLAGTFTRLVEYSTGHPVIRRLSRAEPETLVALWRTGDPCGYDMAVLLLRAVADGVEQDAHPASLTRACELLAQLLFAAQLVPDTATAFDIRDERTVRDLLAPTIFRPTE